MVHFPVSTFFHSSRASDVKVVTRKICCGSLADESCHQNLDSFGLVVYVEVRKQCIRAHSPSMMWVLGLNEDVRHGASALSHLTGPIQLMQCTKLFPELLRTGVIMNIYTICMQKGSQREPEITVTCEPTLRNCFQAFAEKKDKTPQCPQ